MWALWRWLSATRPRDAQAPPITASQAATLTAALPKIPPETLGLERMESRSHPGSYYYRNQMPPPLPDYPCIKGDGLFAYHVFGASHYQQQLERIAGGVEKSPSTFV